MISLWKASGAKAVHLFVLLLALLLPLALLVGCGQPAPPALESLNLGIPTAALQSPVKGPLSDATLLHVGITFKVDPHVLSLVSQQPLRLGQSSNLEQFARQLGISDSTYQKIEDFFNAKALTLKLSKLRTHLSLQAKAGTIARLLHTTFVLHQYKGRTFYAPATPPKVPTFLANTIDAITGLDNYSAPPRHALDITYPQTSHVLGHEAQDCSPDDQTLLPSDVATAYGYNTLYQHSLHGEQMTINLVETDGSYQDDIQNYLNCIQFKGHLSVVNVDGAPSDAEGESTLDIQMAAGLAPAASINVYQTDGNADGDTWTQMNDELQQVIDANTNNASSGSVVSISLGIDEADISSDDARVLDSSLRQLTQVEHMTVFVASGDCGAFADETFGDLSVSFSASDPWAVAVGGTELSVDGQHNHAHEVVWSDSLNPFECNNSWGSGGGNSSLYTRPAWQNANGVNNRYSQNDRQVPDVSAVADNLAVYFDGEWGAVGGTSAAAPIWATAQALVNEDTIRHLGSFAYAPQLFYSAADKNGSNAYFDITRGDNLHYPATPGWDFATGLGTPNLARFDQIVSDTLA
ncbi:MAG TPA: S53 family peptidase [Ktedonosporobacter sp.]|nr:S53 family peptidase [Ktedonosporobacter sp.]